MRYIGHFLGGAALSLALSLPGAANAQDSDPCDGTYTVRPGDTLSQIATKVFGSANRFPRFYDIPGNPEVLGPNPNVITPGMQIRLPACTTEGPGPTPPVGGQVDASALPIDIVSGSDFAPYTHADLPDRGMLTRVVSEAFAFSDLRRPVEIDFINDWSSHLGILLGKMKYSASFPWYKPKCPPPPNASDDTKRRCELIWSDPLTTVSIFLYAPVGLASPPQSFEDLKGRRLCRPSGYFTFDLEQKGLRPLGEGNDGNFTLRQPESTAGCFEMLERGEVDFVSLNRFTAEKAIAELGLSDYVEPLPSVVGSQALHLVADPFNGEAIEIMDKFNEGLRRLKRSPRYNQIVSQFQRIHQDQVDEIPRREQLSPRLAMAAGRGEA